MHVAIVVHTIASVEKVFRTIGSLLLFKTGEIDRSHPCGIDHSLYLDLKIEIVDCAVVSPYQTVDISSSTSTATSAKAPTTKSPTPSLRESL